MSLTTALNIAKQSLQATSRQTAVVSQNVTNASNSDYVRRNAVISSEAPGARVVVIQRAANEALFRANLSAVSSYEGQGTLRSSIDSLAQAVNGVDNANSPAKALGSLYEAIQLLTMLLAVTMALEQLGIGRTAILIVFTVLFGGVVLAFALAFGLGGRHAAREFIEKRLGEKGKDEIEHL